MAASAPGKLILFGEHAVVFGEPALSTAINLRAEVYARPHAEWRADGGSIDEPRYRYVKPAVAKVRTDCCGRSNGMRAGGASTGRTCRPSTSSSATPGSAPRPDRSSRTSRNGWTDPLTPRTPYAKSDGSPWTDWTRSGGTTSSRPAA